MLCPDYQNDDIFLKSDNFGIKIQRLDFMFDKCDNKTKKNSDCYGDAQT